VKVVQHSQALSIQLSMFNVQLSIINVQCLMSEDSERS